jgi:hypothetical protein
MRRVTIGMILLSAPLLSACGVAHEESGQELALSSHVATGSVTAPQLAVASTPECLNWANDPVTGQKCPIHAPCTAYADCGTQIEGKYWYCSTESVCHFLPQTNGFSTAAGTCTGQLLFRQNASAPYDKMIIRPDGVSFREGTTLAFEVHNTTSTTLYLDQIPLTLELAGVNPSRFDVSSIKMYQAGSRSDFGDGKWGMPLVCGSPSTPFGSSFNFTLGTGATGGCGASFSSRIPAGGMTRFVINLAFAADRTYIGERQYRLRIGSLATGVRARTSTSGTAGTYTGCVVPTTGITGSYLIFKNP